MDTVSKNFDFNKLIEKPDKSGSKENPTKVLFVCTGNTCRSPMAAAVLNHLGRGKYIASSAGISAFYGDSISEDAALALENAGVRCTEDNDYKNHSARQVSEYILKDCDKIVAISSRHLLALLREFPEFAEKMTSMSRDISDPYMLGTDEYEKCLSEITECIKEMFLL